ncbi:MAG: PqqD family protein [Paludibacter sp.]|nr:PqqD family protein [Paludibacter sp.]
MRVRKNIATSEEGFLFNPTTGDSFSTNALGAEILLLLKKDISNNDVINTICEKYDVDKSLFERDFEEFTLQLKDYSILE